MNTFIFIFRFQRGGGARRDRTDDLLNANQALFQLSYGPIKKSQVSSDTCFREPTLFRFIY